MLHGIFLGFIRKCLFRWYCIAPTGTKSCSQAVWTPADQCLCTCKQRSHPCFGYSLPCQLATRSPAAPNSSGHRTLYLWKKATALRKNDPWCSPMQCLISRWNYKEFLSEAEYHDNFSITFTEILAAGTMWTQTQQSLSSVTSTTLQRWNSTIGVYSLKIVTQALV